MKYLIITLLFLMIPFIALAELYQWTDSKGIVNYSNNPKDLLESVQKNTDIQAEPESKLPTLENKKTRDESTKKFINETVENMSKIIRQIEKGIKYADEYQKINQPVSKYVLISYINSLSNEIRNLKGIYTSGSLNEEAKNTLGVQLDNFEKKYSEYNEMINDFDSIAVTDLKNTMQIDYKTTRIVDANNNPTFNTSYLGSGALNTDIKNGNVYAITDENLIFTFSATISNTGSKADIAIVLNGVNYQGAKVASHVIKTNIDSAAHKEIGDRIVLSRGAANDISIWEIADVKITRHRK